MFDLRSTLPILSPSTPWTSFPDHRKFDLVGEQILDCDVNQGTIIG
jgi:hypothetical protein